MKVLLYGGGAVGLGLASFLLKSGVSVDIIARPETAQALREKGLFRTGLFGDMEFSPKSFQVFSGLSEIGNFVTGYDYLLVCTKLFDVDYAVEDIARHQQELGPGFKIIICQNGWGSSDRFLKYFPKERVFNARVITGFKRPEPNRVNITVHADAVHLGSVYGVSSQKLTDLAEAIDAAGLPCKIADDVAKDLWAKMLYNRALNPLGAVLKKSYGELGDNPHTREIMNRLISEIFEVMTASGYETHWPNAEEYQKAFYGDMVPATAAHRSSTLQSLEQGRRIEIEGLTGTILGLAKAKGINVPYNAMLYSMVKALDRAKY